MEFDPKIHFAPKKGHGEVAVSIPAMKAEIERLEKELARASKDVDFLMKDNMILRGALTEAQDDFYAAWNDAIEAAYEASEMDRRSNENDNTLTAHLAYMNSARAIRSLKRSQE